MYELIYKVREEDNVGTALACLKRGKKYPVFQEGVGVVGVLELRTSVPMWYKVSLECIKEEEEVIKFGFPIGLAVVDIPPGVVVHVTHVIPDSAFKFDELIEQGFVVGEAVKPIEKGAIVRVGRDVKPRHPFFKSLPDNTKIGIAVDHVPQGNVVRLGNIIDKPHRLGWNEKYRALVRDFYRFLKSGLEDFTRL